MSIPTNEYLLATALTTGITFLKENPDFIDYAIRTNRNDLISKAKVLLDKQKIPIYLNYPIDKFTIPCCVIFMEDEAEDINYIGDLVHPVDCSAISAKAVINEALTFSPFPYFVLNNRPITDLSITRDGTVLPTTDFSYNAYLGKGALLGSYSNVATYTANYTYFERYIELLGGHVRNQFRIELISNNIDEVLALYRIMQFILFSNRSVLSELGLKNQALAGSDLEPLEWGNQPALLYRRALYFSFTIETFGIFPYDVLKDIQVNRPTT